MPAEVGSAASLDYKALKVPGGTLDCVLMKPRGASEKSSKAEAALSAYCMDGTSHILRIVQERYDFSILYNKLVRLSDHVLGEEITISQNGLKRASLAVTSFTSALDLKASDFDVPANQGNLSKVDIDLDSGNTVMPGVVLAGRILKKQQPVYPQEAKSKHISGTVTLSALIGEDGTIQDLDVMSSPSPLLTESAIEAVKHWTYRPYLLNGVPTKVDTTITVNYSFG